MMLGMRSRLLGGVSPVWTANFLSGVLPSGVSVSSPSPGGLVTDSTGRLTYKPNNLLTYSNDLTNAAWTKSSVTTTSNTITFTADGQEIHQPVTVPAGANILVSFTVSSDVAGHLILRDYANNVPKTLNLTTTPTVQAFVFTPASSQLGLQFNNWTGYGGDGLSRIVTVSGLTVSAVTYETTPRAADQVITGASAYYGPAWDYDPVTVGTPLGLRIWESRTNLLAPSNAFGSVWAPSGATVTDNATTSPDGTTNAASISTSGGFIYSAGTAVAASTPGTASIFFKAGTATTVALKYSDNNVVNGGMATLTFATGAVTSSVIGAGTGVSATVQAFPNGWYRVTITSTFAATTGYVLFGYTSGTFYAYGAQLEQASTASPYIPTGASAVTAAGDIVTGSVSWFNQTAGALVATWDVSARGPSDQKVVSLEGPNISNRMVLFAATNYLNANSILAELSDGSTSSDLSLGASSFVANTATKAALGYALNNAGVSVNGGAVTTANPSPLPTITRMFIGSSSGGTYLNGHIQKLAYYNSRPTNAQLVALAA